MTDLITEVQRAYMLNGRDILQNQLSRMSFLLPSLGLRLSLGRSISPMSANNVPN
uniref:Uncharacterized protein n=1 Tax=Arundo donax TaxID=35708 RepID=A0A0A9E6D1_ARUDO